MNIKITSTKTKNTTISLIEDSILSITILDGAEIEIAEAKEMKAKSLELMQGKNYFVLLNATNTISVTKEAREWGSSDEAHKNMIAQAFVVNSLTSRLIGNFIIQFHKPIAKTQIFTEEKAALKWLREQRKVLLKNE